MSLLPKPLYNEEALTYHILAAERKLDPSDRIAVHRLLLDRNYLLVRMKIIMETLESGSNPVDEVATWAREAYDEVVLDSETLSLPD